MGWRHQTGTLGLAAQEASAFIEKAFPRTNEGTFRGEGEYDPARKTLEFQLSHHDAPTGEHYIVRRGFPHPVDGEILPDEPVIEITVTYCEFTGMWEAADTAGEWNYADTKREAIANARRMRRLWREDGYKTKLIVNNRTIAFTGIS